MEGNINGNERLSISKHEKSAKSSFAPPNKQIKSNILSLTNSRAYPKQFIRTTVSGASAIFTRPNPGLMGTVFQGVKTNGFLSLYGGIAAGLQRQVAFCAVRIGLYDNVKAFYQNLLPGWYDFTFHFIAITKSQNDLITQKQSVLKCEFCSIRFSWRRQNMNRTINGFLLDVASRLSLL